MESSAIGSYPESDLAYNRAGRLSPAQIDRQMRSWRTMRLILGGLSVLLFGVGIVFGISGDRGGLLGAWVFAIGVLGLLLMFWRGVRVSQREGAVSMARGRVVRETEVYDGSDTYYLRIADLRLTMTEEDYEYFRDGDNYTVYYIPKTGYLVSGEPE